MQSVLQSSFHSRYVNTRSPIRNQACIRSKRYAAHRKRSSYFSPASFTHSRKGDLTDLPSSSLMVTMMWLVLSLSIWELIIKWIFRYYHQPQS